jgi:hypothetical protein
VAVVTSPDLAALRRAAAAGCSVVLSPETPLYAKPANAAALSGPFAAMAKRSIQLLDDSAPYKAKQALIAEHGLTVYRLTPAKQPDVSAEALAARLGWSADRVAGEHQIYAPPGLTVASLVALAHARLGASGGLRFISDPALPLRRVLVVPGTAEVVSTIHGLRDADALLTGDLREWEIVEYIHDSAEAGMAKALVATGRLLSEQPFLQRCHHALGTAFPSLTARLFLQGDPFWRVQA